MDNFYCSLIFVLAVPLLMVVWGLVMIFNKDLAWRYAEWMLQSVNPQRTPEWERGATINGVILVIAGTVFLVFLMRVILLD